MRRIEIISLILFPFILKGHFDCQTTVTVLNCNDKPVKNAKVTIERCSDHKVFVYKTDDEGKATSTICKDNICKMNVTSKIGSAETSGIQQRCEGDESNYQCVFKLCAD